MFGKNKKGKSAPKNSQYISIPAGTIFNGGNLSKRKSLVHGNQPIFLYSVVASKPRNINYN
jgi:hypothetical protein